MAEFKLDIIGASIIGDTDRVKELVEQGEDVNTIGSGGVAPLHWAAYKGNIGVVKYLISVGADVDKAVGVMAVTPLHRACAHGHLDVAELLIASGADVNHLDDNNWSALHYAARKGDQDMIRFLLAKSANVNQEDKHGHHPLDFASNDASKDLLKSSGATEGEGTGARSPFARTLSSGPATPGSPSVRSEALSQLTGLKNKLADEVHARNQAEREKSELETQVALLKQDHLREVLQLKVKLDEEAYGKRSLQEANQLLTQQVTELKEKCSKLEASLEKANFGSDAAPSEESRSLVTEVTLLRDMLAKNEAEISARIDEVLVARRERDAAEEAKMQAQTQLSSAEEAMETLEKGFWERLSKEVELRISLEGEIPRLKDELAIVSGKTKQLEDDAQHYRSNAETMEDNYWETLREHISKDTALEPEVMALRSSLLETARRNEELEALLRDAQEQIPEMEAHYWQLLSHEIKKKQHIRSQLSETKSKLEESLAQCNMLSGNMTEIESRYWDRLTQELNERKQLQRELARATSGDQVQSPPSEEEAAVIIQKFWRGHQARNKRANKEVASLLTGSTAEEVKKEMVVEEAVNAFESASDRKKREKEAKKAEEKRRKEEEKKRKEEEKAMKKKKTKK